MTFRKLGSSPVPVLSEVEGLLAGVGGLTVKMASDIAYKESITNKKFYLGFCKVIMSPEIFPFGIGVKHE